jgi:hypothetical protein
MQTLTINKRLKRIPNLDNVNLINKYSSYLKLLKTGFFHDQARMMVQFNSIEQFEKAKKIYLEL